MEYFCSQTLRTPGYNHRGIFPVFSCLRGFWNLVKCCCTLSAGFLAGQSNSCRQRSVQLFLFVHSHTDLCRCGQSCSYQHLDSCALLWVYTLKYLYICRHICNDDIWVVLISFLKSLWSFHDLGRFEFLFQGYSRPLWSEGETIKAKVWVGILKGYLCQRNLEEEIKTTQVSPLQIWWQIY